MAQQYDVVIIGGGFCGLSAAIYTTRSQMKTLVMERAVMGGQIINTDAIENYPGISKLITGVDLITEAEAQATKFGAEYAFGEVRRIALKGGPPFKLWTDDEEYHAKAVIIATGGEHKKLGVPGEDEFGAKGVSYCATCDGNFFTNMDVTVVGGGDSAVQEGLYLTRMCKSVTVVHRRDKLRASMIQQERAFANPKMKFVWDSTVEKVGGNGQVQSVALKNLKTGKQTEMPTQGVFVYIGFTPLTEVFKPEIEMDDGAHIKVDIMMQTNVPGVFAAGDCRWKSTKQLANSAGDGVTAAIAAYEFITTGTVAGHK